jgi:uncharacterized damage-inducible protein DinB
VIGVDYARMMARYNRWMNRNLYECSARLDDTERKADRGAFFKSIHGTLNHLLVGDSVWMGRFTGPVFVPTSLAQELHADFTQLRRAREALDERILDWAANLTGEVLGSELKYTSIVNPAPRVMPMALAVAHFFNHQTHHRGQLTTLLMQRGIDPGITDLMWAAQQP